MISGASTDTINHAILAGTQAAYRHQGRPFMTVTLDSISAYELGAFMQWKMMEVMYLGQLLHVNPFDQPHVELYKTETKRILTTS
jgi:glucose-6-phosphate isomerase